jgi:hypothetical protein
MGLAVPVVAGERGKRAEREEKEAANHRENSGGTTSQLDDTGVGRAA